MSVGNPQVFQKKFNFRLTFDGFTFAFFQKCSELKVSSGVVEYRQGGAPLPDKTPGFIEYPNITLERGRTKHQEFYDWMKTVYDPNADTGTDVDTIKREGTLEALDDARQVIMRYDIHQAWPKEYTGGDWDATAEEVTMEKLELVVDSWDEIAP